MATAAAPRVQVGLQTPAPDLRNMALMAGVQQKDTRGVEKNDLLASLEVKVSDTIKKKAATMQLSLEDLCNLLVREGMGKPESAKEAVVLLGQLRLREMARLCYTKEDWFQKEKQRLEEMQQHLALIPDEEVKCYFRKSLKVPTPCGSSSADPKSFTPVSPGSRDCSGAPVEPAPLLKKQENPISSVLTEPEVASRAKGGLQTPAPVLRKMALNAGVQEKDTRGVEKNDLLAFLEVKISDTILKKATTMQLSLEDLCNLLISEDMGKPESAKEAVSLLGKLRLREMARLSYTNEDWFKKEKQRLDELQSHLALLPEEEVKSYFRASTSNVPCSGCSSSPEPKSFTPASPVSTDHGTAVAPLKRQLTSASLGLTDQGTVAPEVPVPALKRQRTDLHDDAGLRAIFNKIDADGSQEITRIEFIKACRKDPSIAEYFGIKVNIQETNGGRDRFESIFQCMDVDNDTKISWDEFQRFCQTELQECVAQMNS